MYFKCLASYYILVTIIFILIFQKCAGKFPTTVVGIFRSENCAPAEAASLAVKNFNDAMKFQTSKIYFRYETMVVDESQDLTKEELDGLNHKIIVTGHSNHCEQVAKLPHVNANSFLVCYGPPTNKTLEILKSTANLYLSQPNPSAIVPSLFNLVSLLGATKSLKHSCPPTVSILLDPNHPFHQVEKALYNNLNNLSSGKIRVNVHWNEEEEGLSSQVLYETPGVHIIIATLHDEEATDLLCIISQKKLLKRNLRLVFLGRRSLSFDESSPAVNDSNSCESEQLLAAADGGFFLEFPVWSVQNTAKRIRAELERRLKESNEHIKFDYSEAPLAYDSVWAMTQAISRSVSYTNVNGHFPENREQGRIVMEEMSQSFTGVSGEFSFNREKVRPVNKGTVNIHQFKHAKFILIGRHFNANYSTQWLEYPIFEEGECQKGEPNATIPTSSRESKLWMLLAGLLLLTLLTIVLIAGR